MPEQKEVKKNNPYLAILYFARVTGILFILYVLLGATAFFNPTEGRPPYNWPTDWNLIIFPFGVAIGFIIGWFQPLMGGLFSLVCLFLANLLPSIPLQLGKESVIIGIISLMFVMYGWLIRYRYDEFIET